MSNEKQREPKCPECESKDTSVRLESSWVNKCMNTWHKAVAPAQPVPPSKRYRFETWAEDHGLDVEREEETGDYVSRETSVAWSAWQACASSPVTLGQNSTSVHDLKAEWMAQDKILDYTNWLQSELLKARASAPAVVPMEEIVTCDRDPSPHPVCKGFRFFGANCVNPKPVVSPAVASITHNMNLEIDCEDDGRWIAEWTNYPGCMAYGETRGEAVRKATDLLFEVAGKQFGAPQSPAVAGRTQGNFETWWKSWMALN